MEFLSYLTNRDNPTHILMWFNDLIKKPHLNPAWPNICSFTHSLGTGWPASPQCFPLLPFPQRVFGQGIPAPPWGWEKKCLLTEWFWTSECSSHLLMCPRFPGSTAIQMVVHWERKELNKAMKYSPSWMKEEMNKTIIPRWKQLKH